MGSGASILSEETIKALETSTKFTSKEILRVLKRYAYYDPNNSQHIPLHAIQSIPEVSCNPIMHRIGQQFLDSETKDFTPSDFVKMFSMLSSRTSLEDKKEFAFKVLDSDGNGYLSCDELFSFYRTLLGPTFSDDRLLDIVMTTINSNSNNNENGLSYEEFETLITDKEVDALFTVDLQMP